MALFTRREHTVRTVEYAVPSGTYGSEFDKAWMASLADYRRIHDIPEGGDVDPNWVQVFSHDDEVILRFEVRREVAPQ